MPENCYNLKPLFPQTPVEVELHIGKRHKQLLKWREQKTSNWNYCERHQITTFFVPMRWAQAVNPSVIELTTTIRTYYFWFRDKSIIVQLSHFLVVLPLSLSLQCVFVSNILFQMSCAWSDTKTIWFQFSEFWGILQWLPQRFFPFHKR